MKSDFLQSLHQRAIALNEKIHTINTSAANPKDRERAPNPRVEPTRGLSEIEADAKRLVDFIGAELDRKPSRLEYAAQLHNTAPLEGETPEQTANRLDAQRLHNPLVAKEA